MNLWISESSASRQTALAVGCTLVGLLLAIGFRNFPGSGSNALAGFMLGMLLLAIGVAGFLTGGKQTVTIEPGRRRILVEDQAALGTRKRTILFSDIQDIGIGFLGKRSNAVMFYYLDLRLRDGTRYPLFAPGRFFPGSSDRAVVEGWRERLRQYLAAGAEP
ncbi:MAG: hypothetical protein JNK22_17000 [Rhodocyclaceae bacterium]|nr:hypothetical protein [Rhodocyclaceae bacterium]